MKRRFLVAASMIAACAVSACQEQRTVVVEQSQAGSVAGIAAPAYAAPPPPPRKPHGASECQAPRGSGPFVPLAKPVTSARLQIPARARAEGVNGCGGVRFRIGPDGVPRDLEILADYPAGYGFGESVKDIIAGSRWSPRDDLSWHYLNATVIVRH